MGSVSNAETARRVLVIGAGLEAAAIAAALLARDVEVAEDVPDDAKVFVLDSYSPVRIAETLAIMECKPSIDYYDWDHEEANIRPPSSIVSGTKCPHTSTACTAKHKGKDLVSFGQ